MFVLIPNLQIGNLEKLESIGKAQDRFPKPNS
jgi:hypothetical protein